MRVRKCSSISYDSVPNRMFRKIPEPSGEHHTKMYFGGRFPPVDLSVVHKTFLIRKL